MTRQKFAGKEKEMSMSALLGKMFRKMSAACGIGMLAAMSAAAAAQTPTVVSSSLAAVPHNESYGNPWQNAVNRRGDFALFDFKTGGLYIYPATGGPEVTFAPNKLAGGFTDSGIAIAPRNNNLYLNNNYNGGLQELPWDAATQSYDLPVQVVAGGLAGNLGGSCGNYFQSAGLAINDNGLMAVATENGCGVEIFTVQINADGTFGAASPVVSNMTARARTVAIDDTGNVYFTEDAGLAGVHYVPAGTGSLPSDTGTARVDPTLGNVQGVSVDKNGNVYIADGSAGVYLVPLTAGVPTPAAAVLLTTAPGQGNASFDQRHGVLLVPISSYNGYKDVVDVLLNRLEMGSVAVGSSATSPGTVYYSFSGAVTPANFAVVEGGTASPDFAVATTGSCIAGLTGGSKGAPLAYTAGGTCLLNVTYTPHTTGSVSATLLMLDANKNVLASTVLHGSGASPQALVTPGSDTAMGSGLKAPQQVAVDAGGNVYVADSSTGKVIEFAAGSGASATGTAVGAGFIAPTGVTADRAGNVFVADGGKVYEVPVGANGPNAAAQRVLASGFGAGLQLAGDGEGNVWVSDPANSRVTQLSPVANGTVQLDRTPFAPINAIAADGVGDLFVASGNTLYKLDFLGVRTTLLTNLPAGVNGMSVDASGSVYITTTTSALRIPNENGTLNASDQVALTTTVSAPTSVAVDAAGNAYIANPTAGNIDVVGLNGSLNLGTLTSTTGSSTGTVKIFNDGVTPLTITGFGSTADFSVTSTTCTGAAIAVGSVCTATVTFNPGPGDQGTLRAALAVQGNQADTGVVINVVGIGAPLAASVTTVTASTLTVTNAPVTVTVKPAQGTSPVPTGNVTLTVSGTNNGIQPYTLTQALTNGSVTFNATEVSAGSHTFTATYQGDRVYGVSTGSTTATVNAGTVKLIQPALSAVPLYVLSTNTGSQPPYDGSQIPYLYKYPLQVVAADGKPLLGVPEYKGTSLTGYDYGEITYQVSSAQTACVGTSSTVNVDSTGAANLDTECLPLNTSNTNVFNLEASYTITPVYDGHDLAGTFNPNYGTVTGTSFTLIALRNPVVQISSNPGTLSVAAGSTASTTLTLTSILGYGVLGANGNLNNYSLPLELECTSLPAHATCSFAYPTPDASDPQSTAVTPTTPGTVVMTINTNVAVGTTASVRRQQEVMFAGVALSGLLLFGLRRRRLARSFGLLALALFMSVATMIGCGTGNNIQQPVLTTPAGAYAVTVTAKQAGSRQVPNPAQPGTFQTVYGNNNQMSLPFTLNVTVH